MIDTLEPIIVQQGFFQGMEERHIHLITGCAKNVRFEQGSVIFREGDPANQFYLIRKGLVALQCAIPHRGLTTIQTLGPDEVLGWSWLLAPHRWIFDARAMQFTLALEFDGACLRTKCEEDHDLGYELYKRFARVVTEHLAATRLQLLDMYGQRA